MYPVFEDHKATKEHQGREESKDFLEILVVLECQVHQVQSE